VLCNNFEHLCLTRWCGGIGEVRWKLYTYHTISVIWPSSYQNLLKLAEIWQSSNKNKNAPFSESRCISILLSGGLGCRILWFWPRPLPRPHDQGRLEKSAPSAASCRLPRGLRFCTKIHVRSNINIKNKSRESINIVGTYRCRKASCTALLMRVGADSS